MSYIAKQSKQSVEPAQKLASASTVSAFADQRASTAVQLKQQQLMHSAHTPNVIQQLSAEEGEPLQGEFESEAPAQLYESAAAKPNNTGLPDNLKSGIENLSGYSMDDVKVHFNSDKPAQLNAHAYAQGTDIHVAPGQEQHLPHEAWHVVQQKQGRVQATMQMKAGVPVNDDAGLENEADVMGAKAVIQGKKTKETILRNNDASYHGIAQLVNRVQQVHLTTMVNGDDRYMGVAGAAGADPLNDSVGWTQALGLDGWGDTARAPQEEFHRAHALANTLGGTGDNTNVGWWSKDDELAWTVKDEQVQGRRLAGFDKDYRPSNTEEGDYTITSNSSQLNIKPNYRPELVNAVGAIQNATLNFQGAALVVANQAGINWDTVRDNVRNTFFNIANARIDPWLDLLFTSTVGGVWVWDDITGNYTKTAPSHSKKRGKKRKNNMTYTQRQAALNANQFGLQGGKAADLWVLMRDSNVGVFRRGNNPFRALTHVQDVIDNSAINVGRFRFTLGDFNQINVNFN